MADPFRDVYALSLTAVRGPNYWSRRSVTRLDVDIGPFDDISSAARPACIPRLLRALPGLAEHQCSLGYPGGFVERLHDGTYFAHIIEHVAIELQARLGLDANFGQTRETDAPAQYTIAFESPHAAVGTRAAELALELVRRAFADGALPDGAPERDAADALDATAALEELERIHAHPDPPLTERRVWCAVTGGSAEARALAVRALREFSPDEVVDVSPGYMLQAGLPYTHSSCVVILDVSPTDVPPRYRAPDRAARLMSIPADLVPPDGFVVAPAGESALAQRLAAAPAPVTTFKPSADTRTHVARAVANVRTLATLRSPSMSHGAP